MTNPLILFPHQLFHSSLLPENSDVILVEESLFFHEFKFHKQKLAFHRTSMKSYEEELLSSGKKVTYVSSESHECDIRVLISQLSEKTIQNITIFDPVDDWLEQRVTASCSNNNITFEVLDSPHFLNGNVDLKKFFKPEKKKFFQTTFYKQERKRLGILMQGDQPSGGKWSYDVDNRKRYPKSKLPPAVAFPENDSHWQKVIGQIEVEFKGNPGELSASPLYPTSREEASRWLDRFLQTRYAEFGDYEDAIVKEEWLLNHSLLSPLINCGLLTPHEVISRAIQFTRGEQIPLNSQEGFIRQIIGWREFIRGVYQAVGRKERTRNFWGFDRKLPKAFYEASTGIPPIDLTIQKVLKTGYCHHIERLMVLGNFMLLCEIDPNEVYRWFMELFIDAYDWVMVPNVYGMSQFADGGLMSTKPYISGSNYLMKMSNYQKGDWQHTWDGLFWRFIHVHRDFFSSNPRLNMMVRTFDKMSSEKQEEHLKNAEDYLTYLDASN